MTDALVLETARGPIVLRPERSGDANFLYALFRSHTFPELAILPLDAAALEQLVRMQFDSQTATYRAQFPQARFDIVEQDGEAIGRLIVDRGEVGCIVDFALLPERRSSGLGTTILAAVLAQQRRPMLCKVLYNNAASLRMCRRVGFVEIGGELPFVQLEWCP